MKNYSFQTEDGTNVTLADCVESMALNIAERYYNRSKRGEELMQDCKVLNSLTNALIAIRS